MASVVISHEQHTPGQMPTPLERLCNIPLPAGCQVAVSMYAYTTGSHLNVQATGSHLRTRYQQELHGTLGA